MSPQEIQRRYPAGARVVPAVGMRIPDHWPSGEYTAAGVAEPARPSTRHQLAVRRPDGEVSHQRPELWQVARE